MGRSGLSERRTQRHALGETGCQAVFCKHIQTKALPTDLHELLI